MRLTAAGRRIVCGTQHKAGVLKTAMEQQLHELDMKHASFTVAFEPLGEPRGSGMERAEFLFPPNPAKRPSRWQDRLGGELSRLMLALKQSIRERCPDPVLTKWTAASAAPRRPWSGKN